MAKTTRAQRISPNKVRDRPNPRVKRSPLSPANCIRIEQEFQALELRKRGYTYKEIADTMGIYVTLVTSLLEDVLTRHVKACQETVENVRLLEAERLDCMYKSIHDGIEKGSLGHVDIGLKVMQRRAKMLGVDMPESKDIKVSGIREYVGIDIGQV